MATSKNNFFKDHYDWLVALVGLVLLAGAGYLFATSLENTPESASEKCKAELPKEPANKDVPQADLGTLTAVAQDLKNPTLLDGVKDDAGSSFASEHRVFCKSTKHPDCRRPIPFKSEVCTWCNGEQPSEKPEEAERKGADLDDDGLPDAWEKRFGLDPNNRADADGDADGDKFSNLEEFKANTDPTNPEDHPDYLDYLTVAGELRTENLPFWFKSGMKTPVGFRVNFVVNDNLYRKNVDAAKGEEIIFTLVKPKNWKEDKKPSGWRVVDFAQKTERHKKNGAGQDVERDASTVDIERISDKHRMTVKVNENPVRIEEQIDLHWDRGNDSKTFTVTKGMVFELNKRKYEVKSIKKGSVTLVDLKTDTRKTIGDGAAEAKPTSVSKPKSTPGPIQQEKRKP